MKDIRQICRFIAREFAQGSLRVFDQLPTAIISLAAFPHRCRVHECRRDPALTARALSVLTYIIYYRVDDAMLKVDVLTVRHDARRQPKRFS